MKSTLLVLSGGLDSCSALHVYKADIALAITFDYGSLHNQQEIRMAKLNCERLGIEHKVIDLQAVFKNMSSALLGDGEVPEGHYEDTSMKDTVVPFRNGIMLSIAAGIADSNGLADVMIASYKGDHAIYPDCTAEFNLSMYDAIQRGTDSAVSLFAPFANLDKREIAAAGIEAGAVASQTYSCYKGEEVQCGRCSTCVERLWALDGLEDSTKYLDTTYWRGVIDAN